jgi:hypothetical protein
LQAWGAFCLPLTLRRYVSELGRELAHTQELLRKSSTILPANNTISLDVLDGMSHDNAVAIAAAPPASVVIPTPGSAVNKDVTFPSRTDLTAGANPSPSAPSSVRYASSPHLTKAGSTFSLETPPASGDIDWDERNVSNVDGMASFRLPQRGQVLSNRSWRSGQVLLARAWSNLA